jgi:hypothetical protein
MSYSFLEAMPSDRASGSECGFCLALPDIVKNSGWILDSGATHNIVRDESLLRDISYCKMTILTGKTGASIPITKVGSVYFTPVKKSQFQPAW